MAGRRGGAGLVPALALGGVLALAAACGKDGEAGSRDGDRVAAGSSTTADDGCDVEGGADETPDASADTTVHVAMADYTITPERNEVPAGTVELVASNGATLLQHELEVVRFDGDPATLPRNFVGGADETQLPDGSVIGRIRTVDPGLTCSATFDLTPGAYVLLCNLVDDGSTAHYPLGMFARLTVTG